MTEQDAPEREEEAVCKGCGSFEPTAQVRFRQNIGKVVMLQIARVEGRYCFRCGRKWFRRMSATTLVKGWWSPQSIVIAPWLLVGNLRNYRKLRRETGVRMTAADWRGLLFRAGAALLALFVVAELVCRVALVEQEGGPDVLFGAPLLPYPAPPEAEDVDAGWLAYDQQRGWAPRPNATSPDGTHHSDAVGLRTGAADEGSAAADAERILLIGSDTAHSTGLEFADSLGQKLEKALPGTEVLNAGVPGYGPGQTFLHLLRVLAALGEDRKPDVVLVFLHPGDFEQAVRVLPPGGPPSARPWNVWLPFGKPRFALKGEHDLSLTNVPPPRGTELALRLAQGDGASFLASDGLRVPAAFSGDWTDLSLLARRHRSRGALAEAEATLAALRDPDATSPARQVTARLIGQMLSILTQQDIDGVIVFAPDAASLAEARQDRRWWNGDFLSRGDRHGQVDLIADLARRATASSLADAQLVDPERPGRLTVRGVEFAAERLAIAVSERLERTRKPR